MKDHGKVFEADVRKSLSVFDNVHVDRIHDSVTWGGHGMIGSPTPGDFWIFKRNGEQLPIVLLEAKATSTRRLDFSRVEDHQRDSLAEMDSFHRRSSGWIAVNFYDPNDIRHMNRCFMIPIVVWDEYAAKGDRKSIALSSCEEDKRIIECPRVKGSIFNMSAWLKVV